MRYQETAILQRSEKYFRNNLMPSVVGFKWKILSYIEILFNLFI